MLFKKSSSQRRVGLFAKVFAQVKCDVAHLNAQSSIHFMRGGGIGAKACSSSLQFIKDAIKRLRGEIILPVHKLVFAFFHLGEQGRSRNEQCKKEESPDFWHRRLFSASEGRPQDPQAKGKASVF